MDPLIYNLFEFWMGDIMYRFDEYGMWWYFTSDVLDLLVGC
jgi:hypothetical protein